ncbi:MAG TPA: ATP synthase F1 subunit delta [Ruminococcaceae bacterium]|nr:ATP synthase F1 subunit delta [Oscillospiraceae bacterium]
MTGAVEKNYSQALFDALLEEKGSLDEKEKLEQAKNQLEAVSGIISSCGGFEKLMDSPAVSDEEKLGVIKDAFGGKLSRCVYNFLCVLTEGKRWGYFEKIRRVFSDMCNDSLGIAEITVTTPYPLSEEQREKIAKKMSDIVGKKIKMSEKTDKTLMGGIIIDYGDTRMDGSVKTRLENLKGSLSQLIG